MQQVLSPDPQRRTRRRRRRQSLQEQWLRRSLALLLLVGLTGLGVSQLQTHSQATVRSLDPQGLDQFQIIPEQIVDSTWLPGPELPLDERLTDLETRMQRLTGLPKLHSGFLFVEPATGRYTALRSAESFSAASVIKVPVFVEFLRQVDSGQIRLDELLTLKQSYKGGGSGWLQYRPNGTKMSALAIASLMIIRSDNTATNVIIDRVGGPAYLNAQFERWKLKKTVLHAPLPDLEGTNQTSPGDLALIFSELERGHLLTPTSRKLAYDILARTRIGSLIPQGIGPGAQIIHKTGDIGKMVGDTAIVTLPDGRRYIAVAIVERPHNDRRANALIAKLSLSFYQYIMKVPQSAL